MRTYRIMASYTVYCHLDIEAESLDAAKEIAYESDGGDFTQSEKYGDWNIDNVLEVKQGAYTCPKFEPAIEE